MEKIYIDKLESLVFNLGDIFDEVIAFKVFDFDKHFEEDIRTIYDASLCVFQNACDDLYYNVLDAKVDLGELVQAINVCLKDYNQTSAWYKVISSMQDRIIATINFLNTSEI